MTNNILVGDATDGGEGTLRSAAPTPAPQSWYNDVDMILILILIISYYFLLFLPLSARFHQHRCRGAVTLPCRVVHVTLFDISC